MLRSSHDACGCSTQTVVNDSFIPKLYPQQQDSECRMVDRLLLQLVTSPIFLMVSSFSLFAIIVKSRRFPS
jgi:hypothetical protein